MARKETDDDYSPSRSSSSSTTSSSDPSQQNPPPVYRTRAQTGLDCLRTAPAARNFPVNIHRSTRTVVTYPSESDKGETKDEDNVPLGKEVSPRKNAGPSEGPAPANVAADEEVKDQLQHESRNPSSRDKLPECKNSGSGQISDSNKGETGATRYGPKETSKQGPRSSSHIDASGGPKLASNAEAKDQQYEQRNLTSWVKLPEPQSKHRGLATRKLGYKRMRSSSDSDKGDASAGRQEAKRASGQGSGSSSLLGASGGSEPADVTGDAGDNGQQHQPRNLRSRDKLQKEELPGRR